LKHQPALVDDGIKICSLTFMSRLLFIFCIVVYIEKVFGSTV